MKTRIGRFEQYLQVKWYGNWDWPENNFRVGTSLVVQWLRLHAPNAGGPGSIPGQGTRSHMPQLRPRADK